MNFQFLYVFINLNGGTFKVKKFTFPYSISFLVVLFAVVALSLNFTGNSYTKVKNEVIKTSVLTKMNPTINTPKNIIFLISDGWSYNTIKATDYYQSGTANSQQYESFPVQFAMATYPAKSGGYPGGLVNAIGYSPRDMWSNFNYAKNDYTESAAAATALSTGFKTYNNSICMDMNYQPLINLVQIAKSKNKSAGVISSVQFSHATPAGFVAHNLTRNNYSQIAIEMLLNSKCDVIMGAGNPDYNDDGMPSHKTYKYVGDSLIWLGLHAGNTVFYPGGIPDTVEDVNGDGIRDPWSIVDDRSEFQSLTTGNTPLRVLGVAKVHTTLQQNRSGDVMANPYVVPLLTTVPTLVEMTKGALNVLDNNTNGFFLMIEGGAVDWASHGNQKGRLIEEQIDFNNSVNAVIQWVNANSNWNETMVIVTGDHECGYLWGPGSGAPNTFNPIINNGQNNLPGMSFYSDEHTNSLIPFFAKGAGSEMFGLFADDFDSVRGKYLQNTEVAQTIKLFWDYNYHVTGIAKLKGVNIAEEYTLDQNFPNPFNPSTTITFNLPKSGVVSLKIYDITGKLVKSLLNNVKHEAGVKSINMSANELASGIYFYSLEVDGRLISTKKMALIK